MATDTILELKNISVSYGGVKALTDVNLRLKNGEFLVLMGPNGAGKSTVLKTIFGLTPRSSGRITWEGKALEPVPHEIIHQGLAFIPQGRRVFSHLTVEENLEIGGFVIKNRRELSKRIEAVMKTFPVLQEKRKAKAGTLSGGQQQMLAIARGLMIRPKVLLLDEPSLGLAPKIVKEVFAKIKEINKTLKTSIIVVEHNLKSLLDYADRGYVLDKGQVVAEGPTQQLVKDKVLEKVFLGQL